MNDLAYVLTIATGIATAIVGGVLFAFSGFVMKALARISADRGIAAMQSINIAVQNWLCSLLFFGTGLTCIVLMVWSLINWGLPETGYVLAGGVSYIFGGLLVTGAFNVPLNNRLAKVDPVSEEGHIVWRRFVPVWMVWNHIRTAACIAASIAFITGLLEM
ncbi:DUF1772 domain-containing protein [Paenibacillus agaridevorans]|uniref:anthrone oxygenase family protein n=1 Tax=Paenibacillus agaridevorans TaxID=171404 RepID=UPI001BE4B116|nr:anthrone oxygenase family protein [Paenibacillus agaridevorans]